MKTCQPTYETWIRPSYDYPPPDPLGPIRISSSGIAQHGTSVVGMPPLLVYEGSDSVLELVDGVTRATRVAKLSPGTTVRVEVLGKLRRPKAKNRRIGDAL